MEVKVGPVVASAATGALKVTAAERAAGGALVAAGGASGWTVATKATPPSSTQHPCGSQHGCRSHRTRLLAERYRNSQPQDHRSPHRWHGTLVLQEAAAAEVAPAMAVLTAAAAAAVLVGEEEVAMVVEEETAALRVGSSVCTIHMSGIPEACGHNRRQAWWTWHSGKTGRTR